MGQVALLLFPFFYVTLEDIFTAFSLPVVVAILLPWLLASTALVPWLLASIDLLVMSIAVTHPTLIFRPIGLPMHQQLSTLDTFNR